MEWETAENMKVHYENVEWHMLAVGIAEVNPNYDPESKAANVNDVDHQRTLIKESERNRVQSFDEAGWSPDLMDAGNEKILAGIDEFMPTVYSTKSSQRHICWQLHHGRHGPPAVHHLPGPSRSILGHRCAQVTEAWLRRPATQG